MASVVTLKDVNKIYPSGVHAVYDFNIDIQQGEFIVMCGPSGCGKSTTLRMIAGLEEISSGDLIINGKRVNDVAPRDRNIAMVFQNYALYAHMTVYHNLAFSLMIRKIDSDEIHRRVMAAAKMLGLMPYLNRKPKQLSGGQRQRVAVGRAIVRNPIVYLLDEPLSNLDAKLRASMRKELSTLHHKLNATFIYVTHDQIEALTLADRIVVMSDGHVQQIASPKEMFDRPENVFVAGFIGTPPMNFYHGYLTSDLKFNQFNARLNVKLSDSDFEALNKFAGKEVKAHINANDTVTVEGVTISVKDVFETYSNKEVDVRCFLTVNGFLGELTNEVISLTDSQKKELATYGNKAVIMASRPDYVYMDENGLAENKDSIINLHLDYQEHLGAYNLIYGDINGERCIAKVNARDEAKSETFKVAFDMKKILFFDAVTTSRITERLQK
ncbi:MAG: ATP-binding cassette domain-containing protein [Acholeplasmatales bacterium]|nr:ATP-binding cassette domain-containing protein [Acholeplasmatales bacterium]